MRNLREPDFARINAALNQWWGERRMSGMVPRPFFEHFRDTSFVVEEEGRIVAFLVGFVSQSTPSEAYIHFVGVHPLKRRRGLARGLYETFFETVQGRGCRTVRCVTSPVNRGSVAFHRGMGFEVQEGDGEEGGVPVTRDYDGPGKDRVLFVKDLAPE